MAVFRDATVDLKRARNKLGRFAKGFDQRPVEILLEEAPRIEEEARLEVPVDTGTLRESIMAEVIPSGRTATLVVSASALNPYDGYDYSNIQHENTNYHHPNGGKPFYIRDPFNRGMERIDRRLREELGYDR